MKTLRSALLVALVMGLVLSNVAFAQSGADVYKTKCAMCHGPDGKKENPAMGTKSLTSPDIQKMSEADLVQVVSKGKGKMPGYAGKLTDDQIKAVVAYVKTLK
ncbi:MAG TPA: cytochrome c [Terriglobales bacterium]